MATVMQKDVLLEYASIGHLLPYTKTDNMKKDSKTIGLLYHKISTTDHEDIDYQDTIKKIKKIRMKYENIR